MSGGLMALAPMVPFVLILFGGLTGLFLLYTIRTAIRQRLRIATNAGLILWLEASERLSTVPIGSCFNRTADMPHCINRGPPLPTGAHRRNSCRYS